MHIDRDFTGVDWYGRELGDAAFRNCRFVDADLSEATSRGAVFEECDWADLSHARLDKARLSEADLREARLAGVDTRGLELSDVRVTMLQAVVFAQHRGAIVEV